MNRKGDVPTMILVLGTVAVCVLALISFFVISAKVSSVFVGVDELEKIKVKNLEYSFYESLETLDDSQIKDLLEEENFKFGEDDNGEYMFIERYESSFFGDEELEFGVKYYFKLE